MLKLCTAATRLPLVKPPTILKVYHSRSLSPLATQYIRFLVLPRLPSTPPSPWWLGRARAGKQQQRGINRQQLWGSLQNIWEALQRWIETDRDTLSEVKFWVQLASFLPGFTLQDLQICTMTETHWSITTAVAKSGKDKVVWDDTPSTQTNREWHTWTVIYTSFT